MENRVKEALGKVIYPNFSKSIVEYGFVKSIEIENNKAIISIEITASSDEVTKQISDDIKVKMAEAGIDDFELLINRPRAIKEDSSKGKNIAPTVKNFVMVSSGKGGVGKSTTTVNLAIAMAMMGKKVGLLDADIYGPNIPRMMNINAYEPTVVGNAIMPEVRYGVKIMSMGMLTEQGQSLIWRGAVIMRAAQQLLQDVLWEDLDILFIDMPPGTGDAQLTIAQSVPVTCGVVVTTPQKVAMDDTYRSLDMFKKLHIPLAGIVENMSGFVCPESGKEYDIFGKGNTEEAAKEYETEILANIPIEVDIREGGDIGKPIVYFHPNSKSGIKYREAANKLWDYISKVGDSASNEMIQPTIGLDGKTSACSSH